MDADAPAAPDAAPFDFARVDTLFLDLDGTLLDLAFDNYVWLERVPRDYGAARGLSPSDALEQIMPRFRALEGTLDWYCIEFWSRELGLDMASLHREESDRIGWLPGAREFLYASRAMGKRLVLLTNAHPVILGIKDEATAVTSFFDAAWSSHAFRAPKEDPRFWAGLAEAEEFDPARTLFLDDSVAVLAAARAAGIGYVIGLRHPDSIDTRREHEGMPAVDRVADLLGSGTDASPAGGPRRR
jgi:putative hydrolase of the HAD superfamily